MSAAHPETLNEQLFYVTVRLEAQFPDGNTSIGTGFFYDVPTEPDTNATVIVTNKHVLAGASSLTVWFLKKNTDGGPALGHVYPITLGAFSEDNYCGHPDPDIDVAVLPAVPLFQLASDSGNPLFYRSIVSSSVPTLDQLNDLDAVEDVRFVGYPDGIYDKQNYLPVTRRGTTASYLQHDYEGRPVFLIDASVFPGSSGSPVVIADSASYATKTGLKLGGRLLLLGIVAEVRITQRVGDLITLPTSTIVPRVSEMLDLGIVYKARTIDECVDVLLTSNGLSRRGISAADEATASEVAASDPA
ncbi:S1 family peptidase [Curtobacterium flaccumfaciens]|uniref:S1 family peptidase n=1 Tax=Curtobacterium flaccumfaciens TaxID=2035 RepID=UPI003D9A71F9